MSLDREVGLVLAGGGARGAYEAGALSILLPYLEERGQRPGLVLGTSVGALNAGHIAATAHLPAGASADRLTKIWSEVEFSDIIGPLVSRREAGRLLLYLGGVLGIPGASAPALFDTTPLPRELRRLIDIEQLHRNIDDDLVALAVVATSYAMGDSVVFHEGPPGSAVASDPRRATRYVPARIGYSHMQASASIPVAFPATHVAKPSHAAGWYGDGGTRLNTPLKPALQLGATRVVVIGLSSSAPPLRPEHGRPDIFDGAAQIMQGLFAQSIAQDIETLAGNNLAGNRPSVPYIFIAPHDSRTVGRLASEIFRRHFTGVRALIRAPDLATLGAIIGAGKDATRGELFSFLFFATEFHEALIELGRQDAQRWLDMSHDDGPWRLGYPPRASAAGTPARGPGSATRRRRG